MRLTVIGVPVPQGSKTAHPFRRKDGSLGVAVHEGGKAASLKDWRRAIADAVRDLFDEGGDTMRGPVVLAATFYLPRPKSAPKRRLFPDSRPDCDKLFRSAGDALSKVAYEDDSRIVDLFVRKRFANGRPPGVEIELRPATEADLLS
jgi:Holliday junction resolvase RusA-like endonuclease